MTRLNSGILLSLSVVIDEVHICIVTLTSIFETKTDIVVIDVRTSCHSKWFKTFLSSVMSQINFKVRFTEAIFLG